MTDIGFYHLTDTPLERALPKLLEKVLQSGKRALVKAGSEERVESLNATLWSYRQDSFLPHGSLRDGNAEAQPVWLTAKDENPNGASILILSDGAVSESIASFERCLEMFDGNDEAAVAEARLRRKSYQEAGHICVYHQQTESGGWEQKT